MYYWFRLDKGKQVFNKTQSYSKFFFFVDKTVGRPQSYW